MRPIDQDTITQAVISRHSAAGDARLREVMTSLVQHLHAFARDVSLSQAECAAGVRFLAECGRPSAPDRPDLALLADTLGLSMLVTALDQRRPAGCTEAAVVTALVAARVAARKGSGAAAQDGAETTDEPCYVQGQVRALCGTPIAGAEVRLGPSEHDGRQQRMLTGSDGRFVFKALVTAPSLVAADGPVARLLHALGRHAWRPAHLNFIIDACGYERLVTQVFRKDDPYLDSDAAFGVRAGLVADWVRHANGRTPDGSGESPFTTLAFDFVLNTKAGDKP
jgi:hydroxyquinol 1,2-dioxygenase